MEGLTQPPVSPERDGGEGFVLTQPPCVDEAGADAPPRIAFVLRPTAAAAAASTERWSWWPSRRSSSAASRRRTSFVDMERTATTTLRPFVSASHATLRVALEDGMDVAYVATHTMSDGKTAAGLWLGGERLAAGQERRIAVGATLRFGTLKDEASMLYDNSLGGCVGLVFGQFSEASKDVSSLLADVATALSESRWISMGCACPDQAKALLSNELHREWGTTAAKYRARYLISGLKFVDGTWTSKARALSHRLEDDARRLADRAALATLTTNLRCDG
ncbi:methyltransferase domain-containing protein [Aureococcus anophagefferens]|nr:methyltransferase domain-containing protein [Aureococcus anophagefferens]